MAIVTQIRPETRTAKTFHLTLTTPMPQLAGQYYVVRLTAPDGYTASRSYSVASAPNDSGEIELTVERLEGGEVSQFLHDEVMAGDELEVRGPIGLWFVWEAETPAILVGGGSGVVPLMAMLRLARELDAPISFEWQSQLERRMTFTTPTSFLVPRPLLPTPVRSLRPRRGLPADSPNRTLLLCCSLRQPPSYAARLASLTSRAGCSWGSVNPWTGSGLNGLAPPVSSFARGGLEVLDAAFQSQHSVLCKRPRRPFSPPDAVLVMGSLPSWPRTRHSLLRREVATPRPNDRCVLCDTRRIRNSHARGAAPRMMKRPSPAAPKK